MLDRSGPGLAVPSRRRPLLGRPGINDSDWPLVLPSLRNAETVPEGWPGIGWFRRKIRTSAEVGNSLGFQIAQAGASEIYLDGRKVATFGTVSTGMPPVLVWRRAGSRAWGKTPSQFRDREIATSAPLSSWNGQA